MKMKANEKPGSEQGQAMVEEEAHANYLTRFERFKKWAKENLVGVSAVAISVAGIVTTVVMTGRKALKKAAKPLGNFGKALPNLAKKARPKYFGSDTYLGSESLRIFVYKSVDCSIVLNIPIV